MRKLIKTGTLESKGVTERDSMRERKNVTDRRREREGVMPVEHKVGVSAVRRLSE